MQRWIFVFVAGFLAVLCFHQAALGLLNSAVAADCSAGYTFGHLGEFLGWSVGAGDGCRA